MLKLMRNLRPYTWAVIGALASVLAGSVCDLTLPSLMADIINQGVLLGDTGRIIAIGWQMLAVSGVGMAFSITASYLAARVGMGFGRDLRSMVFNRVTDASVRGFDQIGTASLITRTTNDITQIQQVVIMMIRMMASAPMTVIGGTVMALREDAGLAPILLFTIPLLLLSVLLLGRKATPFFTLMQAKTDKLNQVLRENLTGIRVIRAFRREAHERRRFDAANLDMTETSIRVNNLMALAMPLMMLLMNATVISLLWFGGLRIESGAMQIGSLIAFIQYAMQILFSMLMLSMVFIMVPRASASARRIDEVLSVDPEISSDGATRQARGGAIRFENVVFRHEGAENPTLENITFAAEPGETTAIIGSTGSGKSTLLSLVLRFYDIESGRVTVGGADIREIPRESLRRRIGYVPQTALLFTGTIADNLRMGRPDATAEDLADAAATAQAIGFIRENPAGFDAEVSQGGANFSGGQKQRLCIARALIRKPDIYLFDDSFSALDYRTDAQLRAALKQQTRDATVIIVAQRISTVMDADRIVVLDNGRIAGIGKHGELLHSCSVYREIVLSQLSEEEIA